MEADRGERWSKYTAEEHKLVDEAKRNQKATTESAKAALKVKYLTMVHIGPLPLQQVRSSSPPGFLPAHTVELL